MLVKNTLDYITKIIGVNKSTISREIKKGTFKELNQSNDKLVSHYLASFAQGTYKKNQLKLKRGVINQGKYKYHIEKVQKMIIKENNISLRCDKAILKITNMINYKIKND